MDNVDTAPRTDLLTLRESISRWSLEHPNNPIAIDDLDAEDRANLDVRAFYPIGGAPESVPCEIYAAAAHGLPSGTTHEEIFVAAQALVAQRNQHTSRPQRSALKAQRAELESLGRQASDIKPESVKWLIDGLIPLGKLTLVAGNPGEGKTMLMVSLAATVSRGGVAFNGTRCEQGRVLLMSAEDGAADTLVPRLAAAGADLKQVRIADVTELLSLPDEIGKIEKTITHHDIKLVVLDPLNSYLDGAANPHQDASVRQALAPLASAAASTGAAFVTIFHLNKDSGGKDGKQALYRPTGSIGFVAASRAAFVMAVDPTDKERRVLAPLKFNLGVKPESWAFEIREERVGDGSIVAPFLACVGKSGLDADRLLSRGRESNGEPELDRAMELLRDMLADGPKSAEDIEAACTLAQVAERTARRAYGALKLHSYKLGFQGDWYKALPGDAACLCRQCRKGGQTSEPPGQMAAFDETATETGTSSNLTIGHLWNDGVSSEPTDSVPSKAAKPLSKVANGHLCATPTETGTSSKGGQIAGGVGNDGRLCAENDEAAQNLTNGHSEAVRNREVTEDDEIARLAAADAADGESEDIE